MLTRRDKVKVVVSLLALAASAFLIGIRFFPEGCGPSEDEVQLLKALNSVDEIVQRGGHVNEVTRVEDDQWRDRRPQGGTEARPGPEAPDRQGDRDREDSVYRFEAEIYDAQGVAIGRLRGGRIEGFGTMTPRIQWYKTPGVPEEWSMPPRWGRGERDRDRRPPWERRENAP